MSILSGIVISCFIVFFLYVIKETAFLLKQQNAHLREYNYDIYQLASLLNAECDYCLPAEKLLIGSTVLNRMRNYQKGMTAVLSEKGQYQGYNSENYTCTPEDFQLATELMAGKGRDSNVIFFFQKDVAWADSMTTISNPKFVHKFAF